MPFGGRLSLSARLIIGVAESRPPTKAVTAVETFRELALQHEESYDKNARMMEPFFWSFRLAIFSLVCEVAFWSISLSTARS